MRKKKWLNDYVRESSVMRGVEPQMRELDISRSWQHSIFAHISRNSCNCQTNNRLLIETEQNARQCLVCISKISKNKTPRSEITELWDGMDGGKQAGP